MRQCAVLWGGLVALSLTACSGSAGGGGPEEAPLARWSPGSKLADGPYAFLNANDFVSSDPGSGSGGVSITFYQRQ